MQQAEKNLTAKMDAGELLRNLQDQDCLTLSYSQVAAIRSALLTGLHSFAEIERTSNEHELARIGMPELKGNPQFMAIRPLHPTGAAGTCGDFATALSYIEIPCRD